MTLFAAGTDPWPPDWRTYFVAAWNDGIDIAVIRKKLGVSKGAIARARLRYNLTKRDPVAERVRQRAVKLGLAEPAPPRRMPGSPRTMRLREIVHEEEAPVGKPARSLSRQCQWPLTCTLERDGERLFCPHHTGLLEAKPRRKAA